MVEFIRIKATDQKGAASILVIFMLLVLVTLGALAISSANANYKLSQQSLTWNKMYYELDAQGEEFLSALDKKLTDSEIIANEYIKNKEYQSLDHPAIPAQMQKEIFNGYREDNLDDINGKICMYYADIYLNELTLSYSGLQLYTVDSDPFIDRILVELQLTSESEASNKLNISMWVEPVKEEGLRYIITDWYEYQEAEVEEQDVDLWDGTL